jgi:hypothetical protein
MSMRSVHANQDRIEQNPKGKENRKNAPDNPEVGFAKPPAEHWAAQGEDVQDFDRVASCISACQAETSGGNQKDEMGERPRHSAITLACDFPRCVGEPKLPQKRHS